MSIHNDFGREAKENFGGILELDDGEREHCEASEPSEILVPAIRKGEVLVAGMTTGDGYARVNERPLKVLATRAFHDESSKCIIDVIDVLDGEKGTLSLQIRDSVTTIRVQRHKYVIQGWCGPEDFDPFPLFASSQRSRAWPLRGNTIQDAQRPAGKRYTCLPEVCGGKGDYVTLVVISCLGEYRLVALGVGDVM